MAKQLSFWRTPKGYAALALIGVVAYLLLVEHRNHIFQFFPFLILLLCLLMHMFLHGGHGRGDQGSSGDLDATDSEAYRRGVEDGRKQSHDHSRGSGGR